MVANLDKDGSLRQLEIRGELNLLLKQDMYKAVAFKLDSGRKDISFKAHPIVEKGKFAENHTVELRDPSRGWSVGAPNNILKWRLVSDNTLDLPLVVNCWPSAGPNDLMTVNMEYEYKGDLGFDIYDVVIRIPIVAQSEPSISIVDGETRFDTKESVLEWRIGKMNESNGEGNLEFEIQQYNSDSSHLFPISISFRAEGSVCGVKVEGVKLKNETVPYSIYSNFSVKQYEIG